MDNSNTGITYRVIIIVIIIIIIIIIIITYIFAVCLTTSVVGVYMSSNV